MNRLNTFLKYFILIVPHVSSANLPSKNINLNSNGYKCFEIERISHNLPLDDKITDRLNRICWCKHSNEFSKYYLVAVSTESSNEGTAVDVPFEGRQTRVIFYNNSIFKFKVFDAANGTWKIECKFPETPVAHAQRLFNRLYGELARPLFTERFTVEKIRKYPIYSEALPPYSWKTFMYHESSSENSTFIFSPNGEMNVSNPILIISNGDYNIVSVDEIKRMVLLRVTGDDHPYVFYFSDEFDHATATFDHILRTSASRWEV